MRFSTVQLLLATVHPSLHDAFLKRKQSLCRAGAMGAVIIKRHGLQSWVTTGTFPTLQKSFCYDCESQLCARWELRYGKLAL